MKCSDEDSESDREEPTTRRSTRNDRIIAIGIYQQFLRYRYRLSSVLCQKDPQLFAVCETLSRSEPRSI